MYTFANLLDCLSWFEDAENILGRWLDCSQLPELARTKREQSQFGDWPEAAVFSTWWQTAEDACLSAMLHAVAGLDCARPHISLHFDGLLLSRELVSACETQKQKLMCGALEEAVLKRAKFTVQVVEKKSATVLEALKGLPVCSSKHGIPSIPPCLLLQGNCIPLALGFVTGEWPTFATGVQAASPANTLARERGHRKYADWNEAFGVHLRPFRHPLSPLPDCFLLHVEDQGKPHCLGVKTLRPGVMTVMSGGEARELTVENMGELIAGGIDHTQVVIFQVKVGDSAAEDDAVTVSGKVLLQLVAGAGADSEEVIDVGGADVLAGADSEEAIDVSVQLPASLSREVSAYMSRLENAAGKVFTRNKCQLCPWRTFERRAHLLAHVRKHHVEKKRWCASGTKQLRIVVSLYDNDAVRQRDCSDTYLARSAQYIQDHVKPGASQKSSLAEEYKAYILHVSCSGINCAW